MSDRMVKVVGEHSKNCGAVKQVKNGSWATCWGPVACGAHGNPFVTTVRRYGKNGRVFRTWIRYVCNSTACKAELHIETDYIIKRLAPKSLNG